MNEHTTSYLRLHSRMQAESCSSLFRARACTRTRRIRRTLKRPEMRSATRNAITETFEAIATYKKQLSSNITSSYARLCHGVQEFCDCHFSHIAFLLATALYSYIAYCLLGAWLASVAVDCRAGCRASESRLATDYDCDYSQIRAFRVSGR